MKNAALGLVMIGAMIAAHANAAVSFDCNQSEFYSVAQQYVCLSPTFKKTNNTLRREEERWSNAIKKIQKNLAEAVKDDLKSEESSVAQERAAQAKAELDFYAQRRARVGNEISKLQKCRDEKCLTDRYAAIEEVLASYRRMQSCAKMQIPEECEIYVFNEKNTANRSRDIALSEKYYTFESKIKINRPGKCVYLFLSSQYARVWNLLVTKGTDLRQVFVGADDYQMVRGYPESTSVKIGLNTDAAKNIEMCFSRYIAPEKIPEFFVRHNIGVDRLNIIHDGKIGDNAPLNQYIVSDHSIGARQLKTLRPRDDGWRQLIDSGQARLLTTADLEQMKTNGVVNLDNEDFYLKTSDYKFIFQHGLQGFSGGYVLMKEIDCLPAGSEHERVFLAPGVTPPLNLKLEQTFIGAKRKPDMFSFAYMMLPVKNTISFADCNMPRNLIEKVICADDELRQKNLTVKKMALEVKDTEARKVVDAYTAFTVYRLGGCETHRCLNQIYDKATSWFENEEYHLDYKEAEPRRCQLKNIDEGCEVYAYSSEGRKRKEPNLFISDRRETYSVDVKVNRPAKCVVLLLSSYDPVIWNIYTTPQTDLRAVLAGGYYEQMIRGMKAEVQTKNRHGNYMSDSDDRCLNYAYDRDEIVEAVEELNIGLKNVQVLNQPVVGEEKDLSAYDFDPQIIDGEFLSLDILPEGAGLKQLIKAQKIRKVSKADIKKINDAGYSFIDGVTPEGYQHPFKYDGNRIYLMLQEYAKMPAGLAGSDRVILMVPEGMRVPDNNGGHNDYYRVNLTADQLQEK